MTVMPLLALALFLAAGDPAPDLVESPLDGVTWIVEEIDDRVPTSARPVTLTVANGAISGRSFCNRYHTKRVLFGEIIRVTEVGMNAAGCARNLREQEGRFVTALIAVTTYHRLGDRVLLLDADGRVRLRLVA